MVFSALEFLFFFLPIVLGLYLLVRGRVRNLLLLAASILFYVWGSGELVLLLFVSVLLNYAAGFLVGGAGKRDDARSKRLWLGVAVAANLGLLGYFKYANFFVGQIGGELAAGWQAVVLPIGISFFTFQAMSYVIDVATNRAHVQRNLADFALYVSLFPQLVAGPIVRYHEVEEQLRGRTHSIEKAGRGSLRFAHGLVKKVVVADTVGVLADAVFAAPEGLTAPAAWLGVIAYTVQIYFDFSGYSDMAIGLGLILGFEFPENFARPYSSSSVTEFWRRWHITLSNWFRDYLYIPLGGNRAGQVAMYRNLIVVFFLTGLWHGANWTFIVWGLYHGALLIIERISGWRTLEPSAAKRAVTLFLVMMGWVLFRADSLADAASVYAALFSFEGIGLSLPAEVAVAATNRALLTLALGSLIALAPANSGLGARISLDVDIRWRALRFAMLTLALPYALLQVFSVTFSPFLYFQF